jgi:hypothetical protein
MRSTACFLLPVLIVPVAFAQRGGGTAGRGAAAPHSMIARPGPVHSGAVTGWPYRSRFFERSGFGPERGFRNGAGYFWPYYPIWDYSSVTPLYYEDEFSNGYPEQYPPVYDIQSAPIFETRAPAPRTATAVIHDYSFPKQTAGTVGKAEFTIVLKDGSTRSAVASWVAGGQLHYIDPDSRQQALAPALIDRKATEEANQAKNLSLTLPPG